MAALKTPISVHTCGSFNVVTLLFLRASHQNASAASGFSASLGNLCGTHLSATGGGKLVD